MRITLTFLADTFNRKHSQPLEQLQLKGFTPGPNNDITLSTLGFQFANCSVLSHAQHPSALSHTPLSLILSMTRAFGQLSEPNDPVNS